MGHVDSAAGDLGVCHFDLHPDNVIVTPDGWRVIDWLNVGMGPTAADFARTLLLRSDPPDPRMATFMHHVRIIGSERRGLGDADLAMWIRVVAAARTSEGFVGEYVERMRSIAMGAV